MLLDITQDTKILEKVRHSLMLISLLFTLIFLCIGIFLVKIGLSPLNKFIQKIKKLTPNRLDPLDLKKLPLELNQLLIEINSLIVRIKYSHEALSSFSSNIAHELRTPINNLMISNERFLEKNVDLNQINELTTSNLEEYQRLSNLIDKLLFLAKLSADNKQFNFSTLDINKEIKKVIEFHEALAEEKVINIIVDAQGFICADKDLFHNALSNILTNAIKYSPSNSNITIISKESGHQNIISIIDEGYGLPEEEIERITTRYYRFYKKENTSSGLGLGLSIVNSIMKALNAQLEIQLNEDVGITVKMIFHAHN